MKRIFLLIFFISFLICSSYAQINEREKPFVLKAVAPTYIPAAALALKVEGKVEVEVKIDREGEVKSTKIISGHTLLQALAKKVAAQWLFNANAEAKTDRLVIIAFLFHRVSTQKEQTTLFLPPYQTELFYYPLELVQTVNRDPASTTIKTTQPKVLKYNAPKYPPAALATLTQGETVVDVKIDKAGNVVEAKAESGHIFLRSSAENAAMQWTFSTDKYGEERKLKLTFAFNIQNNKNGKNNKEIAYKTKFKKPYRFEITATIYPSANF